MGFIPSRVSRLIVVALFLAGIVSANDVAAQTTVELERGRNLFRQSLSMEVAGDWAGALSRLEQVSRIKMTPQVRFHLARCKEHLGRLTEALGDYRLAEYEASQINASELGEIRQARQGLEIRVPKLVVTLNDELAEATVELDGIALGDSRLGKEIPVDPGEHQLVVRTPDGQSFVKRVRVGETATEVVQIDAPPGFVFVPSRTRRTSPPGMQSPGFDASAEGHTPNWAWFAGGVGVAGVISASVLWYVREKAISDLNNGCGANNICPTSLKPTQTRGEDVSVVAPIALGVGLVGLGIAAYGILAPEHRDIATDSKSFSKVSVKLGCDTHFAGVNVAGAF